MTDYERVEAAIGFIRGHVGEQPELAEIAAQVHVSPYHFQRLFCRWAGVTPKRFLQALTLESLKDQLAVEGRSVFAAALETGLSGGSRVYDHFVQLEAVTPSEYRSAGRGLRIAVGEHESVYGRVLVAATERGICRLCFLEAETEAGAGVEGELARLRVEWPAAEIVVDPATTEPLAARVFADDAERAGPVSLRVRGTNFQVQVWRALLAIPEGTVTTYGALAAQLGRPGAARAVGTAVGANPVAVAIPCHRVIRQSGALGGYRWGLTRKHAMLSRELAGALARADR